jgi:N-acetylmuramoyl-L-alanine amidase
MVALGAGFAAAVALGAVAAHSAARAATGRASQMEPRPPAAVRLDAPSTGGVRLAGGEMAAVRPDGALTLEVRVPKGGATDAWLGRYVADPTALRRARGRALPKAGETLRLALAELNDAFQVAVVQALFPGSAPRGADWVHAVGGERWPASAQTLERIAAWYTGSAANAGALATRNEVARAGPRSGQEIVVPHALLLPAFARRTTIAAASPGTASPAAGAAAAPEPATGDPAARMPGATTPAPATGAEETAPPILPPLPGAAPNAAPPTEDDFTEAPSSAEEEEEPSIGPPAPYAPPPAAEGAGDLAYGMDSEGGYAIYRLKRGEALYSAVVIRFTGRVDVQEVNDLAAKVARRSGIGNVTGIRVGYPVKIPLDDLLPEYLPRDDERRRAWERSHAAVERYTNPAGSQDLDGVAVILDAGHGGRDIGAAHHGIWEHDYVYDVLCRIKHVLETRTRARVLPTIKDRREGYAIHDSTRLPRSRSEVLLTNPPFALTERVPSVNLRWYLSNAWFRRLTGEGVNPDTIVFTSLHADARHPSLRGAMVYVPGSEYRRGRYGSAGAVYARYREARETPFVSFTRAERERSEGLSRQFAAALIDSFAGRNVAVHPYGPVRERIIRRGRSWVPAVLRCNIVPVQVLVEISNLSNAEDSRALADPAYRQRVAEAYVDGLVRYFSAPSGGRPRVTAGAASRSR